MWFERREPITQRKVNSMFAAVNEDFMVTKRDVQKSWITVVRQLCKANRATSTGTNAEESDDNDESNTDSEIL
jgi:hypothetical protein